MKQFLTMMAALSFTAIAYASESQVVVAPIEHLFIPQGFDNNDNVEVVVTGKFPNPCYIRNNVEVTFQNDKVYVEVTALSRDDSSSEICEPLKVPFTETITLGNLQGGDYEIVVNEKSRYEKRDKLAVGVSSSHSVDDHLYPIVEYVELGFTGGLGGDAILMAKTPSDCVAFDKVEYISNGKDTISILPIMKKTDGNCNEKKTRIQIPLKFNLGSLPNRDVLLFVRSIEGKSINTILSR